MRYPNLRYGKIEEFVAYTSDRTIAETARDLRRDERTVRNWLAQRGRVPFWAVEIVRLRWEARHSCPIRPASEAPTPTLPPSPTDETTSAPRPQPVQCAAPTVNHAADLSRAEIEAWIGVHAPNYLSSERAFNFYAKGWSVAEKIERAKQTGVFEAVRLTWEYLRKHAVPERATIPRELHDMLRPT